MSRNSYPLVTVPNSSITTLVIGYDRPLQEYFLQLWGNETEDSDGYITGIDGDRTDIIEELDRLERLGFWSRTDTRFHHLAEDLGYLCMDLPIPQR